MAMAAIGVVIVAVGLVSTGVGARQGGDPPGNNGTVKINDVALTGGAQANDPHVGCTFNVAFFNFDASASASVSFAAHPPTGTSGLLSDSFALDADGADSSVDGVRTYNLATALVGNFDPHPNQGYHVKLTVNATGSQGADVKHKVFWVECAQQTTTLSPTTTTTAATTPTTVAALGQSGANPAASSAPQAAVQGVVVSPGVAEGELARTGINPVLILGLGLAMMLLGATVLGTHRGRLLLRRT